MGSQKRCSELETMNERLKQDREEILGEIQACKRKMAQSDIDLEEANRRAAAGQDDVILRQRKIEELQYKLEASTREAIQRDSLFEKLTQERRAMEEELKDCVQDLEKMQKELGIKRKWKKIEYTET